MGILDFLSSVARGGSADGGILGSRVSQAQDGSDGKMPDWLAALMQTPGAAQGAWPAATPPMFPPVQSLESGPSPQPSTAAPMPSQAAPITAQPSLPPSITAQAMSPQPQSAPPVGPTSAGPLPQPAPQNAPAPSAGQPLTQSGPGLLDRLTAGATNLSTGGNPLAGLLNAINGIATGTRTDRAGITQAQMQSTYHALVAGGIPEPAARAAALNPEVLKIIAPELYSKPTFQKTGTDPLTGQDSGVWLQPDKMKATPAVSNGVPVGADGTAANAPASMQQVFDSIEKARASGAGTPELVKLLPNSLQEGVSAMVNGRALPASLSNRGAARDLTVRFAHAVDPGFDETMIPMRTTFAHGMAQTTPNSPGGQKGLFNTAIQHLAELAGNYVDLHNSNGVLTSLPGSGLAAHAYNAVANSSSKMGELTTAIADNADKVAGETGKLYSGNSGGGQSEREAVRNRFGTNITPSEAIGGLETSRNLMMDKLNTLQNQRDQVYGSVGEQIHPLIDPETKAALKKIDDAIVKLRGGAQQQAPQAELPKPDAEGWVTLPGGVRIRQKPGA